MENHSKNTNSYFHLNCRSLANNWDYFKELLCELHNESFSFDFIGISELWKCEGDFRLNLPGYHKLLLQNRQYHERGGAFCEIMY